MVCVYLICVLCVCVLSIDGEVESKSLSGVDVEDVMEGDADCW